MKKDDYKMFIEKENMTKDLENNENLEKFINSNDIKKHEDSIDNIIDSLFKFNKENLNKNLYSIEFKIKVVEYINQYKDKGKKILAEARKIISKCLGIDKTLISRWEKNYVYFKDAINIKGKRVSGGGRKSNLEDIEKDIILWIIHNRKAGFIIKIKSIIAYIYSIDESYHDLELDIIRQRINRLLKKYNMAIKKSSHIGQPLPIEVKELINKFLHEVVNKRYYLGINDNELNRIVNIDETVIYFENPATQTIDINGKKEVIIDSNGNENKRISVLLSICGDGTKIAPFCIFDGENEKRLEKELNNLEIIKNQKLYAVYHKYAWCDSDIFQRWYEEVYLKYEKFQVKKNCLLILDKSPSHYNKKIIDLFEQNKTSYIYIPGGLTRYLQPLDISVNKTFKESINREYALNKTINNINLNKINNKKPIEIRKEIISIINHIWWETNDITSDGIINGFKKGGINLKEDGSEDEDWQFPAKIIDNYSIYDEFEFNINHKCKKK